MIETDITVDRPDEITVRLIEETVYIWIHHQFPDAIKTYGNEIMDRAFSMYLNFPKNWFWF